MFVSRRPKRLVFGPCKTRNRSRPAPLEGRSLLVIRAHATNKRLNPKRFNGVVTVSFKAPLLSRGGESRRGSGGWGGAGQKIILLINTTPSARAKVASQLFLLPRSHPSSSEEGSFLLESSPHDTQSPRIRTCDSRTSVCLIVQHRICAGRPAQAISPLRC